LFNRSPMCDHHDGAAYIVELGNGAIQAGCQHNSCSWDWAELRKAFEGERPEHAEGRPAGLDSEAGGEPGSTLPEIRLPGDGTAATETAKQVGQLLAATGRYYSRGGVLHLMRQDDEGNPLLEIVKPAALVTAIEAVGQPVKRSRTGLVPTVCTEQTARIVLEADAFRESVPPITCITRCPVLIERNGQLMKVEGYDRKSGIWAAGQAVPDVPVAAAKTFLAALVYQFLFAAPADRSRALAAIITPALVLGGLLRHRAPATLFEANDSQTGKGYLAKIIAAVYADTPATVVQSRAGEGWGA
jgi:hypothetical protein